MILKDSFLGVQEKGNRGCRRPSADVIDPQGKVAWRGLLCFVGVGCCFENLVRFPPRFLGLVSRVHRDVIVSVRDLSLTPRFERCAMISL